jgi:hypothetical protein
MKLVFIYGPVASGKLTVARELAAAPHRPAERIDITEVSARDIDALRR